MENTFALKYTQPLVRGMGFNRTLVGVREPFGVWREPVNGSTVDQAVSFLVKEGWVMSTRSHHNGGGLKTVTEVWAQDDGCFDAAIAAYEDAYANREMPMW